MSTNTPRTDAEGRKPENAGRVTTTSYVDLCQQLETELNSAQLELGATNGELAEQCKLNGSLAATNLQMREALEQHQNYLIQERCSCTVGNKAGDRTICGRCIALDMVNQTISTPPPPPPVVPLDDVKPLLAALTPLEKIYDAFLSDGLDEARPSWGDTTENMAARELFSGRGGKQLLTLGDCTKAAQIIKAFTTKHPTP